MSHDKQLEEDLDDLKLDDNCDTLLGKGVIRGKGSSILLFCSEILQQLDFGLREYQDLVLAPTQELAKQIEKVMHALKNYLQFKVHACTGRTNVFDDKCILISGVHVVVGTASRVFDMLCRHSLCPDQIKMFVLDEANEIISKGFKDQMYGFQIIIVFKRGEDFMKRKAKE